VLSGGVFGTVEKLLLRKGGWNLFRDTWKYYAKIIEKYYLMFNVDKLVKELSFAILCKYWRKSYIRNIIKN